MTHGKSVVVPVEPTPINYLRLIAEGWEVIEADGSHLTIQNPEDEGVQEVVIDLDAPTAAPVREEGGAVQWGWRVRAKPSKTPSHRTWHWQADEPTGVTAELCEWEPVYVALATREEAPAETGSMIVKTPCQHCLRMTTVTPESLALYRDHLRAQSQAREDGQ